jgi:tryptophanase
MDNVKERINPIRINDAENGMNYELDFNRDSVRFAENREFVTEDVPKYPATKVPELFWYAFRMHHKSMSRAQTDALLDRIGGLSPAALERLILLFQQAQFSNVINSDDEEQGKNGAVTVTLD